MLKNSASILINRLTQSITTFILVASIARLLGAYELGQYLLAFSFYFVFMTLVSQGFKTLFIREIALKPEQTSVYLVSGTLLQLLFSIIGYFMLVLVVFSLHYSPSTSAVCYVMGLTIIPFSLSNITEAIFQGREKMFLVAISTIPIYIARLLVMVLAMHFKYTVIYLAGILIISEVIILIIQWALISRLVTYKLHIDWNFIWQTAKQSRTFLFIEGVSVLQSRVQILILSIFGGEVVVGLYGAISQLMQPFEIVSHSLVNAYFPKMSKSVILGKNEQRRISESLVEILLIVALPFMIGLLFIGSDLLILVYQNQSFSKAAYALSIVALGLCATAFIRPLSYSLVANGLEIINLWEVFITTMLVGIIGVVFVPKYQLNGAAYTALLMQIISSIFYTYTVYSRLYTLNLYKVFLRPVILSILMTIIFVFLQKINANIYITIIGATTFYLFVIASFSIYTIGGLNAIRAKLLQNKSNV